MAILSGIVFLVLGVSGVLFAEIRRRDGRKQMTWERVEGIVLVSEISNNWDFYVPRIVYSYSFGGNKFTSERVRSFATFTNLAGPAIRIVERYPAGSVTTVFVNPENPSESVLECSNSRIFMIAVHSVSTGLLILGIALLNAHAHSG
jgi:hypothetical protein